MKIEIFGASTSAKRSHAGNSYAGSGILTLDMEGGVARLRLEVPDGGATFRLHKNEALELIQSLKTIYKFEQA
jgi:hypothetical protein